MKISWNWLGELVDLKDLDPKKVADEMTSRGLEVEAVEDQSKGLEKVITAKILERNQHPNADRLSLCKVTVGKGDPLEIVCGAQNMKAGDIVALAQIGAQLPNGMTIGQSKIRGVTSNGMLCSEEELKLKDSAEGILILPEATPLGKPLAEVLGRGDKTLSFSITTNRGDCLSHWGIAREVSAAFGRKLKRPEARKFPWKNSPISIHLSAGESAPQFYGCLIEGVKVQPSPDWLVQRLEAVGLRSINNVVDASNWVLMELGHPTHAYDAALLQGSKIHVRLAKSGEELPLLDGQTVKLDGSELIIADGKNAERPVGLAGVMGGGNSEVRDQTTRIFLECAEFDPVTVRRAAFKHQRKTDAAHRFERGVDPEGLEYAITRLANLIVEWAGGKIIGAGFAQTASRKKKALKRVSVDYSFFENFSGVKIAPKEIDKIFKDLNFGIKKEGTKKLVLTPPSYRLDVNIKEDLADEVTRSIGFDRIPETLPPLTTSPTSSSVVSAIPQISLMDRAKNYLVQAGLLEVVNYGFSSKKWLSEFGFTSTVPVSNPLSEEYEVMVPSLVPGLIRNVVDNTRKHFGSESLGLRLFELRPTFHSSGSVQAEGEMKTTVQEKWMLSFAVCGPRFASALRNEQGEVDFYDLKSIIENMFRALGTKGVQIRSMTKQAHELFHSGQAAEVVVAGEVAGNFGLIHPIYSNGMKLRSPLWIAELNWDLIMRMSRQFMDHSQFKPWSEFPPIERDFALLIKSEVTVDKLTQVAMRSGKPLAKIAKVFDIYRGSQVAQGMTSVAIRVIFYDEGRSLQESEAELASSKILEAWKKELGAELRM
jgi:phenylalanyl-tRNA synthetase beta chain